MSIIKCFFDGCCEPRNPGGTASYGAVIFKGDERVWETSEIFYPVKGRENETSNNVAEYCGFRSILQYLIAENLQHERVEIYGDSNMVIQQMFGRWKIKGGFYVPVALECRKLRLKLSNITGRWIPREQNTIADELSKAKLLKAGIKFKIQLGG